MKHEEREAARVLRRAGLPIREITERLRVSKSSVSKWVRDIELTPEQVKYLLEKNPAYNQQLRGSGNTREHGLVRRRGFQSAGRQAVRDGVDALFVHGCLLYWCEGTKSTGSLRFANSDPYMMTQFVEFLNRYVVDDPSRLSVAIHAHTDVHTVEEIEDYWLRVTGLDRSHLRKGQYDNLPSSSQNKNRGTLPFGVATVCYNSTEALQKLYGSIKELAGIEDEALWLDGKPGEPLQNGFPLPLRSPGARPA